MKAIYINTLGGPEVLQYGELPDPEVGPGEVLVNVLAASVNGADWQIRAGGYGRVDVFPHILGRDFSGRVAALGEGVTEFVVGDAVFGVCEIGQEGTYAEKIAIKASLCAHKPDFITFSEIAAAALTGLTALVSVEATLRLQPGETILIQGGAGGVASFAIELAKYIGAHVITTASPANHDYLKYLGADEIIDYHRNDFTQLVADCDAVLDTVGGDVAKRCFAVLKPGGRAAFVASGLHAPVSTRKDVHSLRPMVRRDRKHLQRIIKLLAVGAVHVPEITPFKLERAVEAHRIIEGRHLRGKLVLQMCK